MYLFVLKAHMLFALVSITGFVVRGLVMLVRPEWLRRGWVRTIPHINDTLLLLAGLWLAWIMGFLTHGLPPWLAAKLVALVGYIVLGAVALRYGPTRSVRAAAWVAALAVFTYIVTVARMRTPNPLPLLF